MHPTDTSAEPGSNPPVRVFGILATYRRADCVRHFLDTLDRQSLHLDQLVVADNGSDRTLAAAIAERTASVPAHYLDMGVNRGPAGALRAGLEFLAPVLLPSDLIVHFDDDDPPVADHQLARLVATFRREHALDDHIGGVGLSGGTLRPRTGLIAGVTGVAPTEDVDHLHGGYTPVYLAKALQSVDGNDPSFFFGFEELELGRRLHADRWRLIVDNELMAELIAAYPKRAPKPTNADPDRTWSRFHKERNLIRILKREHRWTAIAFTVLVRHIGRPLVVSLRTPRSGIARLVLGVHATSAGMRGRTGVDDRYPPSGRAGSES